MAVALFVATLLATLVAYRESLASLVRVWSHSDTYAHGFLVAPMCGLLVWQKRRELEALTPRATVWGLLLLLTLGLVWLVGRATDTQAIEHLSLIATVPALVLTFFGPAVTRTLAFPLCFLAFAFPFGDAIQNSLMDFTAASAVRALRWSGVPVVREGLYLTTPVAQWRVVDGCSGLRFLISGFALCCLYAYWNFQSTRKRVTFALFSLVALILANGFRAYALIFMGYLSHMRLGVGLGHILFGWFVFAAVMAAFFLIGSRFRDPPPEDGPPRAPIEAGPPRTTRLGWIATAVAAIAAVLFWPAAFSSLSAAPGPRAAQVPKPEGRGGWVSVEDSATTASPAPWRPAFRGASTETSASYRSGGAPVHCYIGFYDRPKKGAGLIQYQNTVVAADDATARDYGEQDRTLVLGGESFSLRETRVSATDGRLVVWHWYWFPDEFTGSRGHAKLLQARATLLLRRDRSAVIVLSTPEGDAREAEALLQQFASSMLPSIRSALRTADAPR